MDGPRTLACGALLWALLSATGCAGTPPPPKVKSQEPPPPPATVQPEAEPAPTPAPKSETITPNDKPEGVEIVIEPGGEKAPVSLAEAGRAERERRARSGLPVAVITNKTLAKNPKGQVTVADPKKKPQAEAPAAPTTPATPEGAEPVHDEQYWRSRSREIRARWQRTAEEVKKLEASAAGLRRRFYAEDDPYVRDSKVKPEWDRVLDRLDEAREEVEAVKKELADFEEAGRREGALPGWVREGVELEPAAEKKKAGPGEHAPIEPPVYVPSEPPPTR